MTPSDEQRAEMIRWTIADDFGELEPRNSITYGLGFVLEGFGSLDDAQMWAVSVGGVFVAGNSTLASDRPTIHLMKMPPLALPNPVGELIYRLLRKWGNR